MIKAYTVASKALARRRTARPWSSVAGPLAALILSMRRIGWSFVNARSAKDDLGNVWSFIQDPPIAVERAAQASVRRWRFARIAAQQVFLVPAQADAVDPAAAEGQEPTVVDCTSAIAPLLLGRKTCSPTVTAWLPQSAAWLVSAYVGGQWTQARRAAVPAWHSDPRCALCQAAIGTLLHRRTCPSIVPHGGWPTVNGDAQTFIDRLEPARRTLLQTRAQLALKVVVQPPPPTQPLTWIGPPPACMAGCTVYIDGSLRDPEWDCTRRLGSAVVVVSASGALLAIGWARPPPATPTAAAAEAFALAEILCAVPQVDRVITDCKSLLDSAAGGRQRATRAAAPLAATWLRIASALDGRLAALVTDGRLVWMPSHTASALVGVARKSDGAFVTMTDWRANRLADAIAKAVAAEFRVGRSVRETLSSAASAVKHEAALLGVITATANGVGAARTAVLHEEGEGEVPRRDTLPHARPLEGLRKRRASKLAAAEAPPVPLVVDLDRPTAARRPVRHSVSADVLRNARARLARRHWVALQAASDGQRARRIVAALALAPAPAAADPYARFEALRSRVATRAGEMRVAEDVTPAPPAKRRRITGKTSPADAG